MTSEMPLREKMFQIIFGTDTPAGKWFDIFLIYAILLSVAAVMLDSVGQVNARFGRELYYLEWLFTLLFTIEYGIRIWVSPKPFRYVFSFYGAVDLLSIVPTYAALIFPGANYLLIIRLLRVLRVFRVLKLVRYSQEASLLMRAMYSSRRKISVFFMSVLVICTVFGSLMFVVEGPTHGFTSIPKSIYWTIVTVTTVGYGDITPQTMWGQVISTLAMLTGYSIIAIPTGIVSAELIEEARRDRATLSSHRLCERCGQNSHPAGAAYCFSCGGELPKPATGESPKTT
jgi:Kef-type K+ transport systems, predicted NAD-binding component